MKERIVAAGNTVVPAFLALQTKGYKVWRSKEATPKDPTGEEWTAESDHHVFEAEDVLTLLGLVAMFETRRPDWKASDADLENYLRQFP